MLEIIGIGDKKKNNGILFLVSTGDRDVRIEVGYGLEGKLPDGKTGRILDDYVIPYFRNDDWDNGIKNGFNAIIQEVCEEYDVTIDGAIAPTSQSYDQNMDTLTIIFGFSILTMIVSGFFRATLPFSEENYLNSRKGSKIARKKKFPFGIRLSIIITILEAFFLSNIILILIAWAFNFCAMVIAMYAERWFWRTDITVAEVIIEAGSGRRRSPWWWWFFRRRSEQAGIFKK